MDYCTLALESLLKDQKVQYALEVNNLVEESNFIYECVNSGYISLENLQITPVTEGVVDSMMEFIDKLFLRFKEASVKRANKYVPWLKECREEIKARAAKMESKSLSPLWKGKWREDGTEIVRAIRQAVTNYNGEKYDDYGFTKKFLKDSGTLTDSGSYTLTEYMKLYFRYGEQLTERPDNVTVTSSEMTRLIDDMFEYVINFGDIVVKSLENNNKNIQTELKKLKPKTGEVAADTNKVEANTESVSSDTWVSIEQRPISETILNTLPNYVSVFEETTEVDKKKAEAEAKALKDKQVQQNKDQGSVTSSNDADGDKPGDKASDEPKPEDKSVGYIDNVNRFARLAIAAYQTTLDERYLLYINIFKDIGDASGGGPKFKDGKYISKKDNVANDTTKVKSAKESMGVTGTTSRILGKLNSSSIVTEGIIPATAYMVSNKLVKNGSCDGWCFDVPAKAIRQAMRTACGAKLENPPSQYATNINETDGMIIIDQSSADKMTSGQFYLYKVRSTALEHERLAKYGDSINKNDRCSVSLVKSGTLKELADAYRVPHKIQSSNASGVSKRGSILTTVIKTYTSELSKFDQRYSKAIRVENVSVDRDNFVNGFINEVSIGYWDIHKFTKNARDDVEANAFWTADREFRNIVNSKIANLGVHVTNEGDDWDCGFHRLVIK